MTKAYVPHCARSSDGTSSWTHRWDLRALAPEVSACFGPTIRQLAAWLRTVLERAQLPNLMSQRQITLSTRLAYPCPFALTCYQAWAPLPIMDHRENRHAIPNFIWPSAASSSINF